MRTNERAAGRDPRCSRHTERVRMREAGMRHLLGEDEEVIALTQSDSSEACRSRAAGRQRPICGPYSARRRRLIRSPIAICTGLPSKSTSCTAYVIGISTW